MLTHDLPRPVRLITAVSIASLLAACGGGGGTVTSEGDPSGSVASGSGSASVAADASCEPVGEELEADAVQTVAVDLSDYTIELDTSEVAAGVTTFEVVNGGTEPHELAFLPGGGEVPLTDDGAPDEEALEAAGAFELEAFAPDGSCEATYDLEPGTYTLFCIVESPDGDTHAEKGMVTTLTVT